MFLRAYYSIYDMDDNKIGLVKVSRPQDNSVQLPESSSSYEAFIPEEENTINNG